MDSEVNTPPDGQPTSPRQRWPDPDADHVLVSSRQILDLEQCLFESGLPVAALMEKASLAIAALLLSHDQSAGAESELSLGRGVLVLVGPGNNGGDGLVVARELALAGISTRLWSPFSRRKPLCEDHWRHARWLGLPLLEQPPDPGDPALWIDALFGIGQQRALPEPIEQLFEARRKLRPGRGVALDVPSGLCADSGRILGKVAFAASLTLTVGLLKRGLIQDRALEWVGRVRRVDLGLTRSLLSTLPPDTPLALTEADLSTGPLPAAPPAASKYQRGRLMVIAGSERFQGTAALALKGALASGCGSLRACLPNALRERLWLIHPEVVNETSLPSDSEGALLLGSIQRLLSDPKGWPQGLDTLMIGPGIGLPKTAGARDLQSDPLWGSLQLWPRMLVLDADALNRLAQSGHAVDWLRARSGPTWMTPHSAEFQRLFPDLAESEPLEAACQAARMSGAVILLKGARSVVAAPDGRRWQVAEASSQVARTGLGDVLAGYCAGLAAQESRADASLLAYAMLSHAEAGRRCVAAAKPTTASEVAKELKGTQTAKRFA